MRLDAGCAPRHRPARGCRRGHRAPDRRPRPAWAGGGKTSQGDRCSSPLLLRPPGGTAHPELSLVAGLAVAESVEESRDAAGIKWPNDVLLGGRKVAGVLLEGSEGDVVCGIGINVAQSEDGLPSATPLPAGSLVTVTGRAPDRAELLVSLLEILEHRYDTWCRSGLAPLLDELEARNVLARQAGTDRGRGRDRGTHRARRPPDASPRRRHDRPHGERRGRAVRLEVGRLTPTPCDPARARSRIAP